MSIRRRRDFWPFELLDDFFEDFWKPMDLGIMRIPRIQFPRLDIKEDKKTYTITAEVPGYTGDDIDIEVKDDTLTISSEHKEEREEKEEGYILRERRQRSFCRALRIPKGISHEDIQASIDKGLLTITIPKKEPEPPKKVKIKEKEDSGKKIEVKD
ncbi:MAG: Hsp20/alpha crystallin family protein [Candidatus Helarchaeota archaeon]